MIVFIDKNTDHVLSKISIEGTFPGEIKETAMLLAYENNIDIANIDIQIEKYECLNCGHKQQEKDSHHDVLGEFLVCDKCNSSFDIH